MALTAVNPATGVQLEAYAEMSEGDVRETVQAAHRAFQDWRRTAFGERAVHMRRAGELLRERAPDYARIMASEMGKPLGDGRAEVEKCALACEYYANNAARFLASEPVETDARRSLVIYQPLGVVLAVMPWNFPFWQVFRFAAPALMAGNAALLKHASNVPGCGAAIEQVFRDAGFPEHLFRTLFIASDAVAGVIEHPLVQGVTLTGSTAAGRAVARKAGELVKKTVLELGGSDAYVVLADADLEVAAATCVKSRLINAGQSCISGKRFIVVESVRAAFEKLFLDGMRAAVVGDPFDPATTVGPLARHDLRDDLHQQVVESIKRGAHCLLGGALPDGPGAFYPPTILTNVRAGMPAYDDELFGPVAAIIPVADEVEAIRVANDSKYGLGAAVFTRDLERGERIATEELEAGSCFVNAFVRSDPRLPFGGVKESGYGRELSWFGIREFVNIKTVWVE